MTDQVAEIFGLVLLHDENGLVHFEDSEPLNVLARSYGCHEITNKEFAVALDANDPLGFLRKEFVFPVRKPVIDGTTLPPVVDYIDTEEKVVYFVGNSLGLQPRGCRERVVSELDSWGERGVNGHFEGPMPWLNYDTEFLVEGMASIVGAIPTEIAVMNSLTVNLHLLLIRFMSHFSPASKRSKILVEAKLFPSDLYAIESELRLHGFEHPADCIEYVHPRKGEFTIRTEDIISRIDELGDALAIVMFSGVQFYTGQLFDIPTITRAAHSVGAKAIWDLAHAAGNVDLYLHDWQVDGACWCSYKYLNGGPGGVGGFFIHENHFNRVHADRLLGWWSHNVLTRFEMSNEYDASLGASEFRLSNVPILSSAALLASLDVFAKTSMPLLRAKSILLTNYLEILLNQLAINEESSTIKFQIITCKSRGAQLSILFESDDMARSINRKLEKNGVMVDYRKPGLIRAAPAPLYCSFSDVFDFYEKFKLAFIDV